ncbi:MAG: DUF1003 domain-containing protein [Bacteroidota bacterium]|nr:DUF1003 domain-containing protein [Bacteroidota bacterium]
MANFKSDISGIDFPANERVSAKTLRKSLFSMIQNEHPDFNEKNYISLSELNDYRQKYIEYYLQGETGILTEMEETVLNNMRKHTTLSDKMDESDEGPALTLGQRLADKIASFGGSWRFIIMFGVFIFIWICINIFIMVAKPFDPYPFILLNLILSCLAALQAPVIMMSQNRQEQKDRQRSKKDYMINLKSELEIRMLHEKIDHLIMHQQQELIEIQQMQIDMMNDIMKEIKK